VPEVVTQAAKGSLLACWLAPSVSDISTFLDWLIEAGAGAKTIPWSFHWHHRESRLLYLLNQICL